MINSAYKVLEHKQEFPLFIKKSKKWLYIGNYKMYNTSAKKEDIVQFEQHAHKNTDENVAVFFLRKTDNAFIESFKPFPEELKKEKKNAA